ncbi:steroid hormone receptor ERR2 [Drosophila tropicalis]|uniref:steroid hormone receptor ERR2 n=1 Tax=Drosophila tropicalis TaxID=46794 RepID=UPI0035ABA5C2
MSDGVSILHIKQEVDTSSSTGTVGVGGASTNSCYSPNSKTNTTTPVTTTSSSASTTALNNSSNSNSGMKSSPSVSPERQLCSSTTSLSCDLHNVSLSNDGDSPKGGSSGGGGGGVGGSSGGGSGTPGSAGGGGGGGSSVRDELRRLCLVCGDVASGFHYGVASCEACKAFFKRTIQGNIEYTCPANNECEINKRRRKACQACRFQKCLLMGMLKEGVRLDRVRGGRQKYRRNPVSSSYQTMQLLYQSGTTSLCDVKILEVLNSYEPDTLSVQSSPSQQPHTTSCNDEASSSSGSIKLEGSTSASTPTPNGTCIFQNNNNDPQEILSVLSDIYDKELVGVIGWAKQIPGFIDLPLNDQMKLLQVSWAEILTLQLTFRSLPFNGKLCFASDMWMNELLAKECGYTEFYYHCVQIAQRMERISPRREEYYLLKALLLSNCDILLDDQSSLRAFRDTILNSLNDVVYLLRHSSAVSHQQQLLLILPSLRQADDILRRFWRGVARDETITMKKLFLEMLEPLAR